MDGEEGRKLARTTERSKGEGKKNVRTHMSVKGVIKVGK